MQSPEDTIAAIATPLGEGGLGVIRLSGADALKIVSKLFRKTKPSSLRTTPSSSFPAVIGGEPIDAGTHGSPIETLGDDDYINLSKCSSPSCHVGFICADSVVDQVVITLFRSPRSYTGEDIVEISAHGSPFTLQKILNLCLTHGARLAGPGEFTERAFLNGKMDLTQAEAVAELIHAKSDKSQAAAMAQMQGGLARKVRDLRDKLLPLLAHVEVGLDHADEDHDFLAREHLTARCRDVQTGIESLLQSARVGKILREGLRVAFLGKPNVGKSSLLNALLKEDRAIVTPTPGTTRDTLEESVRWNGIPIILTDTAGLRGSTDDPVERLGMDRTRQALERADLIVAIFDGSEPVTQEDDEVFKSSLSKPHICVMNKCDLPKKWAMPQPLLPSREKAGMRDGVAILERQNHPSPGLRPSSPFKGEELIFLSAKTGEGLDDLIKTLTRLAVEEKAQGSEAEWLLNTRHQTALERAQDALAEAVKAAEAETFEECVALELQTALQALGEIIGETTTEDLLGQIFSKFCIGK